MNVADTSLYMETSAPALADSEVLWPNPFAAPDVPPRERLVAALTAPALLEPWLVKQIQTSAHCQRALAALQAEVLLSGEGPFAHWRAASVHHQAGTRLDVVSPWKVNTICSTRSIVPAFDEGCLGWKQTGHPPDVWLESGPSAVDGIQSWHGYLCTLAEEWPDELPLPLQTAAVTLASGLEFLIHRGVGFHVSEGQLFRAYYDGSAGGLQIPGATVANSAGVAIPGPPSLLGAMAIEEQRLRQFAEWLESGLKAEREWRRASREAWRRIAAQRELQPLDVAPGLRESVLADSPSEVRLSALTNEAEQIRFEIIGRDLLLDIIPWRDGAGCSVWILGTDGELTPALDGAAILDASGLPSPPVRHGETEIGMPTAVRGFALVDADGDRLHIKLSKKQ